MLTIVLLAELKKEELSSGKPLHVHTHFKLYNFNYANKHVSCSFTSSRYTLSSFHMYLQ